MQPVWGWSDTLKGTGFSDAALRRQNQRKQVDFELGFSATGRTQATLWDIARLRVARMLGHAAVPDPRTAFELSQFLVDLAYGDLIKGKKQFTTATGKTQPIVFAVFRRSDPLPAPRLIRADPKDRGYRAAAFKELVLVASDPENNLFPLHWAVLSGWEKLPDLPEGVRAWIKASTDKMQGLFTE